MSNLVDVDFRYVIRDSYVNELTGEHFSMPGNIKVLQWRKKVPYIYEGIARNGISEEWQEWQDVRTEEE